jgi:uncharacterized protein YegP (UPF0339 family)
MRCELYTDTGGKHRRRMVSSNGRTVASSGRRVLDTVQRAARGLNVGNDGAAATIG